MSLENQLKNMVKAEAESKAKKPVKKRLNYKTLEFFNNCLKPAPLVCSEDFQSFFLNPRVTATGVNLYKFRFSPARHCEARPV